MFVIEYLHVQIGLNSLLRKEKGRREGKEKEGEGRGRREGRGREGGRGGGEGKDEKWCERNEKVRRRKGQEVRGGGGGY